jgi:putative ABC transport system permease protein
MRHTPGFNFLKLVAKNLFNRPYRNIATIFTFAIIAGMLFSSQFMIHGAVQSLDAGISRMGADMLVVPEGYVAAGQTVILKGEPNSFFFEDSGFEKISGIPGVAKASPQIYIATLFASCCAAPVQMIAIDPENDFTIATWLKKNPGVKLGKDDIIIGSSIIQDVGKDLMFYGHNFHVVGALEKTGTGVDNAVFTRFEDAYVMADESDVKAVKKLVIPRGMVSAVVVKVDPGTSPDTVAAEIQSRVPGTKVILPNGLLNAVSGQLGAVTLLLNGAVIMITIVSIPLLGAISAMVAQERRSEISILRALGATKSFVMRLMLTESFTLAIIGGLLGIGIAATFIAAFQDYVSYTLKIPFIIPSLSTILVDASVALLIPVIIGGVSSLYPVALICRTDPYENIRRDES